MIFFRNKKKYFFITLSVFIIIYLFISIFSTISIFSFSNEESLDTSIKDLDYEQLISDHESYPIINSDDFILEKLEFDIKFDNPWSIKLIDDNQLIISEKNGRLSYINLVEKTSKNITHKIPVTIAVLLSNLIN